MKRNIEELLEKPYWILDVLPEQVKRDSPGQFFAVERYFLEPSRLAAVKESHARTILKLNCYRSLSLDEEGETNPPPEEIAEAVRTRHVCLLTEDALIVSDPDELYLTVYDPDEPLLGLLRALAAGEGLYLWKP